MKDLFSAFQQDVFRPIVTLLIPGGIAVTPFFLFFAWMFPGFAAVAAANHTETALVMTLVVIGMGLVCEDLGSHYESHLDDLAIKADSNFHQVWFDYLRKAFDPDPIGRRYLRTFVTRLKFELGCFVAFIFAAIGILLLLVFGKSCVPIIVMTLASGLASAYFAWEARQTHTAMGKVRFELMRPSAAATSASAGTA